MRELGVSIYPNGTNTDKIMTYLTNAAGLGYKRVFTCFISGLSEDGPIPEYFFKILRHGKDLGMDIVADVSPDVFRALGVSYTDLEPFYRMGLYGIRLDLGFSGFEESMMSCNPYGLKIELNMSNGTRYLENILSNRPHRENIIGCHNFYPHRYTGLGRKHFAECNEQFKNKNIQTAAFISSQAADHGPWPVNEGLCTLEEHRGLPLELQLKDLWSEEGIDHVIIGNAFASVEELERCAEIKRNVLELQVVLPEDLAPIYRKIILEEPHFNRGDVSEYMVRSTQSRVKYKGGHFPLYEPKNIVPGDILIESSLYERYAGELQIALKPMENSGKTSVVGKIAPEELFLLERIKPWQKFSFKAV